MITRSFTLVTVHGDTDMKAKAEWWNANQDALAANDLRNYRTVRDQEPLVCDVTAVFRDGDGGRLELHISDWGQAAELVVEKSYTITIEKNFEAT